GAGGSIGTDIVAKARAAGYTRLGFSSGPIAILPSVQKAPYDPLRDLAPVSIVGVSTYALVTSPAFPAANAKELVEQLRASPGKYSYSSSGAGATTHLIIVAFNAAAGIEAVHV